MSNNFYEDFMKKQSEMLEKMGLGFFAGDVEENNFLKNYVENQRKMQEEFMKNYFSKEKFEELTKNMNPFTNEYLKKYSETFMPDGFFNFTENLKSPEDLFKSVRGSFASYMRAYDLYKDIYKNPEEMSKTFEKSLDEYKDMTLKYLRENVFKYMPDSLNTLAEKSIENADERSEALKNIAKPWQVSSDDFRDYYLESMKKRPELMTKFTEGLSDRMNKSLDAYEELEVSKYTEEIVKLQREYLEKYQEYAKKISAYNDSIYEILKSATEKTIEELRNDTNALKEKRSFEEFYSYLNELTKKNIEKLENEEEVNKIIETTLNAVSEFKEEAKKIRDEYRELVEVPKKQEVKELREKVNTLEERIRLLEENLEK